MAVKENIEEAEDFDFGEYSFKPEETEINGKKVLDYTGIEHDRIFLVNKKDILTRKRPDWIPELDPAGLEADQFLPVCVMDGDGNYFVQSKIKTGETEKTLSNYARTKIKVPVFETEYYKMSRDLLAASVDYYLKRKRAELKEAGSSRKVSLPRALKTMRASRYEEMVGLLGLCESYKDNSEILDPKLSHFSDAYKKQNHIIFVEQWQPLLRAIVDKRLDMNLQKQDCANTYAKGEETAYGKSGSSNALYNEFGVMIKKQNGSTFSAEQKNRLENTLSAVWPHFGDLRSLAGKAGLTISYADDCNQHARKAVGLYRAVPGEKGEKAIGVSFFNDERNDRNPAAVTLSHEVTHWLDSEKGKETHHFFASDAAGTLENRIAMKFKELVRDNKRRHNDSHSLGTKRKNTDLGDYWFRTCECLGRAMEEHYALSQGLTIFEENPAYLPAEQFRKVIEPMAAELIEENKKHFGMEVMEREEVKDRTESVTAAEQMLRDRFAPDEDGIRKLADAHKKVSDELKSVIDGAPDTFNYLRGANKAMDNKVEAYQKKVAKLATKKRVLELDMRLLAKLPLSVVEWDELERNSAPVDKDSIRLLERGSFEYYAAAVTSANKNAGVSLPKRFPLVLDLPARVRLDFLEKGEDGYSVGENGGWTMPVEEYADVRAANEKLLEKLEGLPDELSHEQPAAAAEPVNNGGLRPEPLGLNNQALHNLFAINNASISYFKEYAENLYDFSDTEHAKKNIGSEIVDVGPAVELDFINESNLVSHKTIYGDTKNICEWVEAYLKENDIRSRYRLKKALLAFEKEYKDLLKPVFDEITAGNLGTSILDFTQHISTGAFGDELKHGFEKYVAESGYAPEPFVSTMFKRRELDRSISGVDVINHEFDQEDTPQLSGNGEFAGLLDESQWEEIYLKKFSRLEPGEKFREFRSELEKSLADKDRVEALKNISGKISVNFETVMKNISEYVSWKEVQKDIRKFAEKRPYLSYDGWKETIANRLGEPSYTGLRIAVNNDQKPWLKIKRSEYENQFAGIKSDFRERDSETFSDEEFSRRFSAGEFDDIFQRLQKSILALSSRSYESNDKETNEENEHKKAFEYAVAWNRLFVNGEPESVRNLRDKWNEKLRTEKEGFLAKKADYEKVARETSDERILELAKEIESFKREVPEVYRAESFSKKQERVFKQAVLDCIRLSDPKYGRGPLETLKNFISPQVLPSFFQEFEQMREEIVMREIERRGINISEIKENKLMETEQKPYSFFVKDGGVEEAVMGLTAQEIASEFADIEPITGLTAKEAVSEYINRPSSVIGVHIPTNRILNDPEGEGMWVLSRLQDGVHHLDDSFLEKGQETTRNDENFIDALSELEEECRSQGLHLSVPFVFRELQGALRDKRLEEKAANEVHPAEPNWKQDKALLEEVKRLDRSSRPNTSIWGSVQNCHKLIPGVYLVSTAGHGGIMVHESVAEKVLSKANLEHTEKWAERGFIPFEEDADINIALVDLYRKHLLEGLSWNKGKEEEFYEYGQKSILRWNPGLLEKMNEEYDSSMSVSESKSSQLSLGNISLNNEHGEDGWQTQDMFIPTLEYIAAAKIDDERFIMPVATWKPAENPEITMYMTKRLIAEPSNAEKEYLDTSINGSPTVFSRKEWDFIHTQEAIELVSEQIKNQEKAQQKNTFVFEKLDAAVSEPEKDISALTASEANERCQKLGYYFEYNDDVDTADIFTESDGDFIATYGAGGFGYTDDLMDEKGVSKIPDGIFREVIALADRFYHATHEEISNEKVHVNEKTPVRVYDAHDIFTQSELDSIRLHTGLDVRDPEYVDLAVYAPVDEDKSRDYKPFFIVATGTDDSRHIWELREGPRGEYIRKNRFIQYIFRGKHDYGSYDYHNLTNLIAASRAAGLIDEDFDLKNYDGGSNNVYTAVRNFEKEYLPKIKFIDRNGNDISLHEGLGFNMTDDHALWSKEERDLIAGFEQPVQEISGEKEEMTVTVSLKQLYEHYARDGKEFSHVGDNNVLTDFGRIRHTGEDGNDYYDLFNEEGILACCDGETVTLKESKDGKNYLINEQDEYPTRFILSDEEFGIATMTRPAQELGASQEPSKIRLEKWEVGGKTYQVRECFFEKDGKTVTRYVGEEDMANGGYPDKDLEAVDERIAYYVDKEKLKTLSDEELLEYIHDNIDESIYEIFDVEVLKNQVSENRNFVIDGASNGMLAKYINRSKISDIEEFRKFAAERITGTAQDKTYFEQMWKAGIEFCREKGWEMPDVPEEYKGLLLNENKAADPAILKMPEITLSEKESRVLPFSIIENVEKKRVNIKFDTMENNPDFPEIIKELKAGGWKFAPSTKQWYPVGKAVEGAKEFAENLQDKYSGFLNEPEKIAEAQEKAAEVSSSVYDGILFFDRNYDEPKEFAKYTGMEEEKASYFLKALGHDFADMNSEKTERFGLNEDKNLVSVMKKDDGSVTLRKFSSVDELLDYACENAQKEYDGIKALYERHQKAQENSDWGKMLDQLYDKALNRWAENLYQVNEIRNAREQEKFAKMSLSQFDKELIDVIDGKLPKDHIFSLGIPGVILQRCGFQEGQRIEMSASRLEFKSKLNWHPFDMKDVIGLDSALQTPVAVFAYGDKEKLQNVIVGLDKDGKNFLAGVHFNQKVRGYEVSDLRTLFPKDNIDWIRWITQGKMIYGDKEKLQALIAQQRINVAEVSAQVAQSPLYEHCLESASSIMQKFGDVNDIFTEEHEFYNDIKEKGSIEQKFYTYYSSLGNMDARELSEHEAGEFYDALKNNDAEKIAEYTESDLHETSGIAKEILSEFQARAAEKNRETAPVMDECLANRLPYVEVIFSERSGDEYLPDGKIWSLAEADKIIPELNDKFSSYLKTEIAVHFPDGDKSYTRESDCTGTFRLDIGTGRKMEPFSDHIRGTCSDIDFINAFEKAWQKNYVPSLDESFTEDLSQRLSETAKEAGKRLASITEQYKKVAGEDNKVHSAFIIEESESKASKAKVGAARGEFRNFFDDTLRDLSETVKKYSASSGFEMSGETLLFAKHAVKNAMIDLYYGESRAAQYGSGFDFTTWRGMIDSIPPVAAYDGLLDIYLGKGIGKEIEKLREQKAAFEDKLEKAEEKLRENPGNPLAAADKTDAENGINAVSSEIDGKSKPVPALEIHDKVGEYTVLDNFRISDGVYQSTLGKMTENGALAAQSYFVIDGNVALRLSADARELMEKKGERYFIGNKYNEPYVLKELIDQKLMPPRDGNFLENLSAYIERHPAELAKKGFFPVTLDNIQKKTAELANLNRNLSKDPLALAKKIISMVDDDNKGAWLKNHGCNTPEGLKKTFMEWMTGQDKKRQRDGGYPPRGEK